MSTKSLEKIIKYGIYLVALVPLIVFKNYLSPFHFWKVTMFRSLIEILLIFYVVLIIKDRSFLPKPNKIFWSITCFVAVFGITTLLSSDFFPSFWGTLERMGGWFTFIHLWLFFIMAISILKTKEDWIKFIKISIWVSLLSSIYGFLQKTNWSLIMGSGGRNKIFGTIGNSALFAGYILINTFLSLIIGLRKSESKANKWIYISIFFVNVLAIFLTGIRGSVAALVVGLVIFGLLYSYKLGSKKIRIFAFSFIALIVVSIIGLQFLQNSSLVQNSSYLKRYSDISPSTYTVQTRLWTWKSGLQGWVDNFKTIILGWGPENFNIPFSKNFNPKHFNGLGSETLFDRAHNMFIEVLVTMGIVGLLVYISIFVFAFKILSRMSKKDQDDEKKLIGLGLISCLIAYIIHNCFIFDTISNFIMFFLILGFIYLFDKPESVKNNTSKINNKNLTSIVATVLTTLVIISIYCTNIVPAKANYTTTRAIVASWKSNHDLAFEKYEKALSYSALGKYEIRNRFSQYILERANGLETIDQKTIERVNLAIEYQKKNAEEHPLDYLPELYLSRAYIIFGKKDANSEYNDLSLEHSAKALKLSPTFVRTYYELAQAYVNKKQYDQAISYFEKAKDLNPDVGISWWYLGLTYIEAGQIEKGLEVLDIARNKGYKPGEYDLIRETEAYIKLQDFQKVAELYNVLIAMNPNQAQYHASLAVTYSRIGKKIEAVSEAKKAASLDSKYAKEAEAFIKSLGY